MNSNKRNASKKILPKELIVTLFNNLKSMLPYVAIGVARGMYSKYKENKKQQTLEEIYALISEQKQTLQDMIAVEVENIREKKDIFTTLVNTAPNEEIKKQCIADGKVVLNSMLDRVKQMQADLEKVKADEREIFG